MNTSSLTTSSLSSSFSSFHEGEAVAEAYNATTMTTPSLATELERAAYIERHLGARHLPLTTIIPISLVYFCIFVVGVLGNVSTCLVIFKNKYMQTPTNLYLANLAISDLMTHLVGKNIFHASRLS